MTIFLFFEHFKYKRYTCVFGNGNKLLMPWSEWCWIVRYTMSGRKDGLLSEERSQPTSSPLTSFPLLLCISLASLIVSSLFLTDPKWGFVVMMADDKLRLTWEKMEKEGEEWIEGVQSISPPFSLQDLNFSNLENLRFKIKDEVWWWSSFYGSYFFVLLLSWKSNKKEESK